MFGVDIFCFRFEKWAAKSYCICHQLYINMYKEVLHHEWVYFDLSLSTCKYMHVASQISV